ncbi:MAG TPA: hypothetical protein DHW22_03355, partial [Planctomycetaceae bacterium]|nr:hypothetical protein [Planctomycetaceae bacterium]
MVIGAECQDLLDSLVQNKSAQDEVARVLSKHLSSTDHDPSQTLTPQEIISAFISRFGRSLNPDDAQYLRGLLDVSPTEADQTSEFFNADKLPSSYSPQEKALDLAGEDYELKKILDREVWMFSTKLIIAQCDGLSHRSMTAT